jgi:hypothetical protein
MNSLLQNNSHLGALLVRARTNDDELVWQEIASTARVIADALRTRDSEGMRPRLNHYQTPC